MVFLRLSGEEQFGHGEQSKRWRLVVWDESESVGDEVWRICDE